NGGTIEGESPWLVLSHFTHRSRSCHSYSASSARSRFQLIAPGRSSRRKVPEDASSGSSWPAYGSMVAPRQIPTAGLVCSGDVRGAGAVGSSRRRCTSYAVLLTLW